MRGFSPWLKGHHLYNAVVWLEVFLRIYQFGNTTFVRLVMLGLIFHYSRDVNEGDHTLLRGADVHGSPNECVVDACIELSP